MIMGSQRAGLSHSWAMSPLPYHWVLPALLLVAPMGGRCAPAEASPPADEDTLIALLDSGAPRNEKAGACARLAVIGTAKSVPALSRLLADPDLSHMARYALEPMADPAAGEALRGALGRLDGKLLIGVIGSIGARRDREAIAALSKFLGADDAAVMAAAAGALGRIGDAEAGDRLAAALEKCPPERLAALGDGSQRCLEALMASGDNASAIRLADAVRRVGAMPWPILVAATRCAILARGAEGTALLVEQLQSEAWERHALGLRLMRELPGQDVTGALTAAVPKLPDGRRVAAWVALGDRGDRVAVPALVDAAMTGAPDQRAAAIQALSKLGNAAVVKELATIAAGTESVAASARSALISVDGPGVDEAILKLLEAREPAIRALATDVARERLMAAAVPALRRLSDDPDATVRGAALRALGQCGGAEEVAFLADRLTRADAAQESDLALAALRAAIARIPDRRGISGKLIEILPKSAGPTRAALIGLLGAAGGTNAFDAVLAALGDPDPSVKDAAARAMSEWGNPDAAPDLLRLAKEMPDERKRILALRGYIGLADSPTLDDPQRSSMCREAMAAATRDEERRLILGVLGSLSDAGALDIALANIGAASLKNEAGTAVLGIAQNQARLWPDRRIPSARIAGALETVVGQCDDPELLQRAKAKIGEIRPPRPTPPKAKS